RPITMFVSIRNLNALILQETSQETADVAIGLRWREPKSLLELTHRYGLLETDNGTQQYAKPFAGSAEIVIEVCLRHARLLAEGSPQTCGRHAMHTPDARGADKRLLGPRRIDEHKAAIGHGDGEPSAQLDSLAPRKDVLHMRGTDADNDVVRLHRLANAF